MKSTDRFSCKWLATDCFLIALKISSPAGLSAQQYVLMLSIHQMVNPLCMLLIAGVHFSPVVYLSFSAIF